MKHTQGSEEDTQEITARRRPEPGRKELRKSRPLVRLLRTPEFLTLTMALVSLAILLPLRPVTVLVPALSFLAALVLFMAPGFLLAHLAFGDDFPGAAVLPVAFVLSAGIFGFSGVPLLILHRSFTEYLLLCGAILLVFLALAAFRLVRGKALENRTVADSPGLDLLWAPFLGLAGVLAYVSTIRVEEPNGDSWIYLAYVRDYTQSDRLAFSNPLFGTQAGDSFISFRTMINGWLLDQAALSKASGIAPVELVLDYLAPALVILSLLAVYALAQTFLSREAALLAASVTALLFLVDLPAVIQTALLAPGNDLVARVTEDKYVARFLFLPIALAFAFLYLKKRSLVYLLAFTFACWSVAAVHPIGLAFIGICVAGFGFFHLIANLRDRVAWKNVFALGVGLSSIALPPAVYLVATGSPLLSRLETSENTVAEALISSWEASKRLLVLGDGSYIMHPAILLNPVVLLAYVLGVPFLLLNLKRSLAAQLLLGVLVFTPILIYVPPIATLLANSVGPWVLVRLSWPIVLAAPLVLTWMAWVSLSSFRTWLQENRPGLLGQVGALLPVLLMVALMVVAAPTALAAARSVEGTGETLQDAPTCDDPTFRWFQEKIKEPSTILAPYKENSCIPARSVDANVVSLRGMSPDRAEGDLRSFFLSRTPDEKDIQILLDHEVDYVLLPADEPLNAQLRHLPGFTALNNPGERYRVYAVDREALAVTTTVYANSLLKNEDLENANVFYSEALLEGVDEQFLAYVGLGDSYTRQGLYQDAAASYEQALDIYPDEPTIYPLLANAYKSADDFASARVVLENAVARFPDNVGLHTQLASLLMYEDPEAAAETQRAAVEMYPEVPDYRIRLGTILLIGDNVEAAERQFDIAVRQSPLSAKVHTSVGLANQIVGRNDVAVEHYERALELNPNYQEARERLEDIQSSS